MELIGGAALTGKGVENIILCQIAKKLRILFENQAETPTFELLRLIRLKLEGFSPVRKFCERFH